MVGRNVGGLGRSCSLTVDLNANSRHDHAKKIGEILRLWEISCQQAATWSISIRPTMRARRSRNWPRTPTIFCFSTSIYWTCRVVVRQSNTAQLHITTPARPYENSKKSGLFGRACRTSKPVSLGKKRLPRNDFLQSLFLLATRLFFPVPLVRLTSCLAPGRLCRACLGAAVVGLAIRGSRL